MELIYLSLIIIAAAFLIIVIYLCFVLKRISNTMKSLGSALIDVERQFNYVTPQIGEIIRETDKTIDDVSEKVKATDNLFDSIEELGTSLQNVNEIYNSRFGKLTDEEMDQKLKPFIEGIKWSEVAVKLYTDYQESKPRTRNELILRDRNEIVQVTGKEG